MTVELTSKFRNSVLQVGFNSKTFHFRVNMSKLQNIQRSLESQLARDVNLKESAQRAFVAYIKSVFLMKDKEVFDVSKLDTDAFSRYHF